MLLTKNYVTKVESLPIVGEENKFSNEISKRFAKFYRRGIKLENRKKLLGYNLMLPKSLKSFRATFREDIMALEVKVTKNSSVLIPSYYTQTSILKEIFVLTNRRSLKEVYNFNSKKRTTNISKLINELDYPERAGASPIKDKEISLGTGGKVKSFTDDLLQKVYPDVNPFNLIEPTDNSILSSFGANKIIKGLNFLNKAFSNPNKVVNAHIEKIAIEGNKIGSGNLEDLKSNTRKILEDVYKGSGKGKAEFINKIVSIYDNPGNYKQIITDLAENSGKYSNLLVEEEEIFKTLVEDFSRALFSFQKEIPQSQEEARLGSGEQAQAKHTSLGKTFISGVGRGVANNFATKGVKKLYAKLAGKKYVDKEISIERYNKEVIQKLNKFSDSIDDKKNKDIVAQQDFTTIRKAIRVGTTTVCSILVMACVWQLVTGHSPIDSGLSIFETQIEKSIGIEGSNEPFDELSDSKQKISQSVDSNKDLKKYKDKTKDKIQKISDQNKDLKRSIESSKKKISDLKSDMENLAKQAKMMEYLVGGIGVDDINNGDLDSWLRECKSSCSPQDFAFRKVVVSNLKNRRNSNYKSWLKGRRHTKDETINDIIKESSTALGLSYPNESAAKTLNQIIDEDTNSIIRSSMVIAKANKNSGSEIANTVREFEKLSADNISIKDIHAELEDDISTQVEDINIDDALSDIFGDQLPEMQKQIKNFSKNVGEDHEKTWKDMFGETDSTLVFMKRFVHHIPYLVTLRLLDVCDEDIADAARDLFEDPTVMSRLDAVLGLFWYIFVTGYIRKSNPELVQDIQQIYQDILREINIFTVYQLSIAIGVVQMMIWGAFAVDFKEIVNHVTVWQKMKKGVKSLMGSEEDEKEKELMQKLTSDTDWKLSVRQEFLNLKNDLNSIKITSKTTKIPIEYGQGKVANARLDYLAVE